MSVEKSIHISVPAALRLVDLILDQAKLADSELVKKILLRAGIKIADLALQQEPAAKRKAA